MKLQIAAHLARGVREVAALLQQDRRRHAARRQHHPARMDLEAMGCSAAEGFHHLARHAPHLGRVAQDLLHLERGEHPGTEFHRLGDVADIHALLGPAPATRQALARAATTPHIARHGFTFDPQGVASVAEEQVPGPLHIIRGGRDAQKVTDRIEVRIEIRPGGSLEIETRRPLIENEIRRPHAHGGIDQGASAETDGLENGHEGPGGGTQAALAQGSRHGNIPIGAKLRRCKGRALLHQDHAMTRAGKFIGHHRARGPGAHHHDVGFFLEIPRILREDPDLAVVFRFGFAHALS